jgi:acetyl-CoA acetyltransferase
MGLQGKAAIAGYVELKPERKPTGRALTTLEQWSNLSRLALEDAGLPASCVDGIVMSHIDEASVLAPSTVAEYLGLEVNCAEFVDLGGASGVGMIWRAAAAIEMGAADTVLCVWPGRPHLHDPRPIFGSPDAKRPYSATSAEYGSPQVEFEIPYGFIGQNAIYAMIAKRYAYQYGYDPRALAKIAADQRTNACANPDAIFYGKPITIDDVLASPMIADPLHLLECVMICFGGHAVVVSSLETAKRGRNRPVRVTGFGERVAFKTPVNARDMLQTAVGPAAKAAFAMAGRTHKDIDMVSLYDCYTITVLTTIEDAGFCAKGEGAAFVNSHDLTYRGDFPCNTSGGQLSFGQVGGSGCLTHVCDAARQIMGRAGEAQVKNCNIGFVTGNGGVMSEQAALILEGY